MIKKTFFSVLFLVVFTANSFAMHDATKMDNPQQQYCDENKKWDYLEKLLVKELNKVNSKTNRKINYASITTSIAPLIILDCIGIWAGEFDVTTLVGIGRILILDLGASFVTNFWGFYTNIFGKVRFSEKIKNERLVNFLETFLQKYNPQINSDSEEINYKRLIPEQLHEKFDLLYKGHQSSGKAYLEKEGLSIIRQIRQTIKSKQREQLEKTYN